MLEKILLIPTLSDKAKTHQLAEFCKSVRVSAMPAIGAAAVLMLFEYQAHQGNTGLIWFWLLTMLLIKLLRYKASMFFTLSGRRIHQRLLLAFAFLAGPWFVAYLFIFGVQDMTHAEILFKGFFVYIIFIFHLETVRYDLRLLVFEAAAVTTGLIYQLIHLTTFNVDLKFSYALLILFGGGLI